jgi:hypothetical protein
MARRKGLGHKWLLATTFRNTVSIFFMITLRAYIGLPGHFPGQCVGKYGTTAE